MIRILPVLAFPLHVKLRLPSNVIAAFNRTFLALLRLKSDTKNDFEILLGKTSAALYHEKVIDHYENPRNIGSLNKDSPNVGTGLVGAPACGDVMKLQIEVDDDGSVIVIMLELEGCAQTYAWGKQGLESSVAQLISTYLGKKISGDTPYAELWMGIHPSGPSRIRGTEQLLSEWIISHPESLGHKTRDVFGDNLPFLLKVLSVNKALSIQAHPNKFHAEQLHAERPDLYKDPNHKPELAVAVTKFEALCGFKTFSEIAKYLNDIPELREAIGKEELVQAFLNSAGDESHIREALRNLFEGLMINDNVRDPLQKLMLRIDSNKDDPAYSLCKRLMEWFPDDVGCFGPFLFNYIVLEPGEALFLGPNEPHAYIQGDCVECMACSDNVVRAGLTPKYKDVPTLVSMLSYQLRSAKEVKMAVETTTCPGTGATICRYVPPVKDFLVERYTVR
ncbi:unnamed protein product [Cyprideis torosa]|uniref:mannose-6-phosphate isomerase n=1 Tax=Cyprideis torosa TaxID=163714 RepID=A0A7R8W9J7_9CRUS|nr:unnamed protein product [Cyprideis torosa]CAG0889893.1 unnamed protein product [Cyprideis torosa]